MKFHLKASELLKYSLFPPNAPVHEQSPISLVYTAAPTTALLPEKITEIYKKNSLVLE
jgi:hypothetical protein